MSMPHHLWSLPTMCNVRKGLRIQPSQPPIQGLVGGDTSVAIPPTLSTSADISSPRGGYPITAAGASDPNYVITHENGTLTVNKKQESSLSWSNPANISYSTPLGAAQLNASASAPGTITYSPNSGTILDAGLHILSASFVPDDPTIYEGTSTDVVIVVEKGTPTITWPTPIEHYVWHSSGRNSIECDRRCPWQSGLYSACRNASKCWIVPAAASIHS